MTLTTVSKRPMPFKAPMVRALLAGTPLWFKDQTRRLVRARDLHRVEECAGQIIHVHSSKCAGYCDYACADDVSPYGTVGDRLWVQEAIRLVCKAGEFADSIFVADGYPTKADAWPWKLKTLPPMFCPYGLSRIFLEIIHVRVERLHDITEEDARAEGIRWTEGGPLHAHIGLSHVDGAECNFPTALEAYRALWEDINGAGSWDANPLVWVIKFKRVGQA